MAINKKAMLLTPEQRILLKEILVREFKHNSYLFETENALVYSRNDVLVEKYRDAMLAMDGLLTELGGLD